MARTHARTKGKSGSSRPVNADLSFVSLKEKDIVKLIVDMAKEKDMSASSIGLVLRDTYAVPSVKKVTGKTITQILAENGQEKALPEDLAALVTRAKALKKHLEKNSRDVHNKRGLILLEAKLRRLAKYYMRQGRIEKGWRYD